MNPKVSVNILAFNSRKYLKSCLDSVLQQTHSNLEIIVVDNASQDGSADFVTQNYPQIKLIHNQENKGFAPGQNQAFQASTGDFIFCLNPDIILDPDYIKNCLELFSHNEKIAVVSGKILKWNFAQNKKENIIDSTGFTIFKSHRVIERGGEEEDKGQYNKIAEVFGCSGAAPIFKKKIIDQIGYFDSDFTIYKEDVDLAFRIRIAGYKAYYCPTALCWHDRWATGSGVQDDVAKRKNKSFYVRYHSYRNHLIILFKDEFFINLLLCFPWIFVYELQKFIYLLFHEIRTLKGLIGAIRCLPLTLSKRRVILSSRKIRPSELRRWYN